MKVAIMQPYFFPYMGYFSLIKHTDMFIILDTVQFIYHGWIERNRVINPNQGFSYIKVPIINKSRNTLIQDIKINNADYWKDKLLAQLQHYKKRAPYYYKTIELLGELFEKDYSDIVSLNSAAILAVCKYLDIDIDMHVFSNMNLVIQEPSSPDEWALNICKGLGNVNEYWNPPGGKSFFDISKYNRDGIEVKFQKIMLQEYNQGRSIFEEGLSIIDVLMFNSIERINLMLDRYEFI